MSLSIGERLKSAREGKGIPLEQACKATKVQHKILEAIEGDCIDDILDPVYAKIFIKKYAGYLGLDGSALVDEYAAFLDPERDPEPPRAAPLPAQARRPDGKMPLASFRQLLIPITVCLIGVIGLAFLIHLAIDFTSSIVQDRKDGSARVAPEGTQASSTKKKPASKLLVPRSQPLKLTIRTKADVWMQIKSDGAVIFQNVLPKGSQESWTAKDGLELWTGNAGAVELHLNGKPIGPLGTGVKKGIKVTRRGIEEE